MDSEGTVFSQDLHCSSQAMHKQKKKNKTFDIGKLMISLQAHFQVLQMLWKRSKHNICSLWLINLFYDSKQSVGTWTDWLNLALIPLVKCLGSQEYMWITSSYKRKQHEDYAFSAPVIISHLDRTEKESKNLETEKAKHHTCTKALQQERR